MKLSLKQIVLASLALSSHLAMAYSESKNEYYYREDPRPQFYRSIPIESNCCRLLDDTPDMDHPFYEYCYDETRAMNNQVYHWDEQIDQYIKTDMDVINTQVVYHGVVCGAQVKAQICTRLNGTEYVSKDNIHGITCKPDPDNTTSQGFELEDLETRERYAHVVILSKKSWNPEPQAPYDKSPVDEKPDLVELSPFEYNTIYLHRGDNNCDDSLYTELTGPESDYVSSLQNQGVVMNIWMAAYSTLFMYEWPNFQGKYTQFTNTENRAKCIKVYEQTSTMRFFSAYAVFNYSSHF